MIIGFDHLVLAAPDLERASAGLSCALGRAPAWRAKALGGAADMASFGLANVAVEALAPATAESPLRAALRKDGPGWMSLALKVEGMEAAWAKLERLGYAPEPIGDGETVDVRTGARRAWRRTRIPSARINGLRLFLIEPDEAHPLSREAPEAARTVLGLERAIVETGAPDMARRLFGDALGLAPDADGFRCGDALITLRPGAAQQPDRLLGCVWRATGELGLLETLSPASMGL